MRGFEARILKMDTPRPKALDSLEALGLSRQEMNQMSDALSATNEATVLFALDVLNRQAQRVGKEHFSKEEWQRALAFVRAVPPEGEAAVHTPADHASVASPDQIAWNSALRELETLLAPAPVPDMSKRLGPSELVYVLDLTEEQIDSLKKLYKLAAADRPRWAPIAEKLNALTEHDFTWEQWQRALKSFFTNLTSAGRFQERRAKTKPPLRRRKK